MGSPEGSHRISVIHTRPSVICNPNISEDRADDNAHDMFVMNNRSEQYEKESKYARLTNHIDGYNSPEIDRVPISSKYNFPRYYPPPVNPYNTSQNNLEWNPNNRRDYLTSELREFNDRSMAFLSERSRELTATFSPHNHKNTIPRQKAVLTTQVPMRALTKGQVKI